MPERKVHAFVLHLLRAERRRANAHGILDKCGLAGEIWPAVDGSVLAPPDLLASVGAELFEPHYPFTLKTGEIGCFLSHRQIWAEIMSRNIDAALIIEDDASIDTPLFAEALELALKHVAKLGYIQLQTRPTRGEPYFIDESPICTLSVPEVGGLRTTAQVVSKKAASQLLSLSDQFDRPVDTFVQSHWFTGLRPAMIHPSGVTDVAHKLDGSTIQAGRKSPWEKLRREVSRARYRAAVRRFSRQSRAAEEGGFDG